MSLSCFQEKITVLLSFPRIVALLTLPILAACSPKPVVVEPPPVVPGYEAVEDDGVMIPAVNPKYLPAAYQRQQVAYNGPEAPGTIVVDTYARRLYLVQADGQATRYAIAVGRDGTSFRGNGYIGRKAKWPSWTPTANMIRTQPHLYAQYAGGLPGGISNPLGSRALYLYRGGRDTMFRIHGTIEPDSIGHATSAGCIRLFNQDVMELYERVSPGAKVKVRSMSESLALEGPMMDDAWGRIVPETPENITQKELDIQSIAAAEQAETQRLRACRRQGVSAADCPVLVVANP